MTLRKVLISISWGPHVQPWLGEAPIIGINSEKKNCSLTKKVNKEKKQYCFKGETKVKEMHFF